MNRTEIRISESAILPIWASQGVAIDDFQFSEDGEILSVSISYPLRSTKVDREGKHLEGDYLKNKVMQIARMCLWPAPIMLEFIPRDVSWTDEAGKEAQTQLLMLMASGEMFGMVN